jgi:hypothetical protein
MTDLSVKVEQLVRIELGGETKELKENSSQCKFIHRNSHMI